jgi:sugar phosphate permease
MSSACHIPEEEPSPPSHPSSFHIRRIFAYSLYSLNEMIVFFRRSCPSVLFSDMAASYKVDVSRLSLFSSMYFYAYGTLQVFTGLIADVFEPALLIGGSTLLAAVPAATCGFSRTFAVGCVSRLVRLWAMVGHRRGRHYKKEKTDAT